MIVIIDNNMGNVRSVQKAFQRLGQKDVIISKKPEDLEKADRIILPGVGSFNDAMTNLKKNGFIEPLNKQVIDNKKPFLAICLGIQLLAEKGYEGGEQEGLGWISGEVKKFELPRDFRIPHMGWNSIIPKKDNILFQGIGDDAAFYFVHSYHLDCHDKSIITSECDYGKKFVASVRKDNIFGTQFHPEKSQVKGFQILENFLKYEEETKK
jgi:glutamine amidotransferase